MTYNDILGYQVISDIDDIWRISVNVDFVKDIKYGLSFYNSKDSSFYIDNPDFLFVDFYEFLLRWKKRTLAKEDFIIFKEYIELFNKTEYEYLNDTFILMINKAKELNWDKINI